jgi:hypothetical protein
LDIYKPVETIPAEQVAIAVSESACLPLKH